MKDRYTSVDSIKGVMIILVVFGHVIYKGGLQFFFQDVHDFIYIFHMPIFLMLSGYFFRCKLSLDWLKMVASKLLWPYLFSFSFYLVTLYFVGVWGGVETSNHINDIQGALKAIFVSPFASYWYLHSLIVFSLTFYVSNFIADKLKASILPTVFVLYLGLHFFIWYLDVKFFYWVAGYLWLGYAFSCFFNTFKKGKVDFSSLLVLVIILSVIITNSIPGFELLRTLISLMIFFGLISLFRYFHFDWLIFLGRNSLVIFLFHVYFINIAKFTSGIFLFFDSSGALFVLFSLVFSVIGPVLIGFTMDQLKISNYIIGANCAIK